MDGQTWAMIIGAVFLGLTQLYGMYLAAKRDERNAKKVEEVKTTLSTANEKQSQKLETVAVKQQEAAAEVREVKQTLQESTADAAKQMEGIAKVGEATHMLVNSAMGAQLKLHAETARVLADSQPHNEAYRKAAEIAELTLRDHQAKQAKVDAGGGQQVTLVGTLTPGAPVPDQVTEPDTHETARLAERQTLTPPPGDAAKKRREP